jgi:hypothetical protein
LTHSREPLRDSRKNFSSASTMPCSKVAPIPVSAARMRCRQRQTVILSTSSRAASARHELGARDSMSATTS